ncbi:MAG TPA: hypothetical protein VLX89_13110 [Actinomycetota bacterium]|nr:hypothetical protein [Actinomycetota bacterium]
MRLKPSFERWFGRNRRIALRWDRLPNRVHLRRGIRRRGHLPNVVRRKTAS